MTEQSPLTPQELIALAEKYEAWSVRFAGMETPTCMAREYRAIAAGLRMMAADDKRAFLKFILDGAENVDINHRDFRIQVAEIAQIEMDKIAASPAQSRK